MYHIVLTENELLNLSDEHLMCTALICLYERGCLTGPFQAYGPHREGHLLIIGQHAIQHFPCSSFIYNGDVSIREYTLQEI